MTVYLADEQPRWEPRSEDDIRKVIDDGLLRENHYTEVKREVGTQPSHNKEIAKDLAGLAIDGGALLIGVAEDKENRTWRLAPQPLDGLGERIERIAMQSIDPPLFVRCHDVKSSVDESQGYVYVSVLASAAAPHMVDGVYYGRGDRTRIRLSDAEVLRHHSQRESTEALASRLLDAEIARDPVPAADQLQGHLYAVAQPLTARRDVARTFVRGDTRLLRDLVDGSESELWSELPAYTPNPAYASHRQPRSHGTSMSSYAALGAGRTMVQDSSGDEDGLLDIELREDGGLRTVAGRMTAEVGPRVNDAPRAHAIVDALAVAYSLRLVLWAARLGETVGYRGSWVFGIHATRLRGLASSYHYRDMSYSRGPLFDADDYRETTTAAHLELLQQPRAVASRLAGRLIRALDTEFHFGPALADPDPE